MLLLSSCTGDEREAETACQQRLVDVSGQTKPEPGASRDSAIARRFTSLSQAYAEMSVEGCTEAQTYTAKSLSRLTRELADDAGVAQRSLHARLGPKEQKAMMTFLANLEQFENRRRVLREELAKMKTAAER